MGDSFFCSFVVLIFSFDRRMGCQAVDGGRQWRVGAGGHAHDRAAASSAGGRIHSYSRVRSGSDSTWGVLLAGLVWFG